MNTQNKYILGDKGESYRLNYQNSHPLYKLENDLTQSDLFAFNGMKILDAGCGNADYSKLLVENNPFSSFTTDAYDQSSERLKEAENNCHEVNSQSFIKFKQGKLEKIDSPKNHYHRIFTRFTFQHLYGTHQKVANEYHRVLKPGGELIAIDADGILFNIFTKNQLLLKYLDILRRDIKIDLFVCQKLEDLLNRSGFKNVQVESKDLNFVSMVDRIFESQVYEKRMNQVRPTLLDILKTDYAVDDFISLLIDEVINPETKVSYKRHIFRAIK